MSNNHPSIYPELERIMVEAVFSNREAVLFDMPELLLRMKIGVNNSLKDLQIGRAHV